LCQPTILHLTCGGLFGLGLAFPQMGRWQWLRNVGRMSYGLYLYHLPIYAAFGLAQSKHAVGPWSGLAALLTTFAVAAVSFRYFESPILRWMGRRQAGLLLGRGRFAISLGSAVTILLAGLFAVQAAQWLQKHPVMPEEWRWVNLVHDGVIQPGAEISEDERRSLVGATKAYRWMGVVHAIDADGFRRTTPFPPKKPGVPRAAAVGDSYVWGACVETDQVLSAVTEKIVADRGAKMEVLNLGRPWQQVEDVVITIQDKVLPLKPEVVVYAATLNDFLPRGQWSGVSFQQYRTDPVFADRFRSSILAMQRACRAEGVAFRVIPYTQDLDDSDSLATVRFMQSLCSSAGVPMIDINGYLQAHAGRSFRISFWDNHPTAECHRLYAEMIAAELLRLLEEGGIENN